MESLRDEQTRLKDTNDALRAEHQLIKDTLLSNLREEEELLKQVNADLREEQDELRKLFVANLQDEQQRIREATDALKQEQEALKVTLKQEQEEFKASLKKEQDELNRRLQQLVAVAPEELPVAIRTVDRDWPERRRQIDDGLHIDQRLLHAKLVVMAAVGAFLLCLAEAGVEILEIPVEGYGAVIGHGLACWV